MRFYLCNTLLPFLVCFFFGFNGFTQDTIPNAGDRIITDEKKRDFNFDDWKQRSNRHWKGLDLGINMLLYENGTKPPASYNFLAPNTGRSFYFGINALEKDITINGEYIKFITGLGFDFYNFHLSENAILRSQNDSLMGLVDTTNAFSKNNVQSSFITVPLLLAFNTNVKHSKAFHFATGVILGYRLCGNQKVEYSTNGMETTIEQKWPMHQQPFSAALTLRFGYANYHIFGNYGLINFFKNGEAPEANSLVIGVKVLPW